MAKNLTEKKTPPVKASAVKEKSDEASFAFGRENYILLLISVGLLFLGYVLMAGGKSDDPAVFNEAVFSFRRITLAPLVVMAGYGLGIYAIVKKAA